jgi:hypothetical protein
LAGRWRPTGYQERLNKKTALAVLSSDAICSVAYATEQTLLVLAVLGTAALSYPGAVRMRGALRKDSIIGVWSVDIGRASGRSGQFVMVRKDPR